VLLPELSLKPAVPGPELLMVLAFQVPGSRRLQTAAASAALAMHTPGAVASSSGPQKAHLHTDILSRYTICVSCHLSFDVMGHSLLQPSEADTY